MIALWPDSLTSHFIHLLIITYNIDLCISLKKAPVNDFHPAQLNCFKRNVYDLSAGDSLTSNFIHYVLYTFTHILFFKSAKFINLKFFHPNPVRLNCINKSFMTLQPETHFHLISSITYYKAYHMEWKCVILKIGIDFRPRTNIFMELLLWLHK